LLYVFNAFSVLFSPIQCNIMAKCWSVWYRDHAVCKCLCVCSQYVRMVALAVVHS